MPSNSLHIFKSISIPCFDNPLHCEFHLFKVAWKQKQEITFPSLPYSQCSDLWPKWHQFNAPRKTLMQKWAKNGNRLVARHHFAGSGVDGRNQHLLDFSVSNSLICPILRCDTGRILRQILTQLKALVLRPNSNIFSIVFVTLVSQSHPPLCLPLTVIIIFIISITL